MNDEMTNRDQADEDILTYTVPDEEIEAAAAATGFERVNYTISFMSIHVTCC